MLKNELIEKIEQSKIDIKKHLKEKWLKLEEVSDLIKKILEWEPTEIQLATNLYYVDWCNIEEISKIMNKSEVNILNYFQLILFKIKVILNIENWEKTKKYSVKNYLSKKYTKDIDSWSLLDKKV
jgi:hypothetical protein